MSVKDKISIKILCLQWNAVAKDFTCVERWSHVQTIECFVYKDQGFLKRQKKIKNKKNKNKNKIYKCAKNRIK